MVEFVEAARESLFCSNCRTAQIIRGDPPEVALISGRPNLRREGPAGKECFTASHHLRESSAYG